MAILTRNVHEVVETFARMFTFQFHAVYTREDGPPKPSPAGALALCRSMGVDPAHTLAVGDYKYDVMAGRDAGCRTVLVSREELAAHQLAEWGSPDLVVKSLREAPKASGRTITSASAQGQPASAGRRTRMKRASPSGTMSCVRHGTSRNASLRWRRITSRPPSQTRPSADRSTKRCCG